MRWEDHTDYWDCYFDCDCLGYHASINKKTKRGFVWPLCGESAIEIQYSKTMSIEEIKADLEQTLAMYQDMC